MRFFLITILCFVNLISKAAFDDYFENKSLRIDYFHTGDYQTELYSIDELIEEPYWAGSKTNLLDIFNYGKYKCLVYDQATNNLIYSYDFSTLFSEWQTTDEAKKTVKTFSETLIIPYPKKNCRIEFHTRNKKGIFEKKFEYLIDIKSYFISKERKLKFKFFNILLSGESDKKVDIVLIPEGYTKDQMEKFKKDAQKFSNYLFNATPYRELKDRFNIRGIEAPSDESGSDFPGLNIWKRTLVGTQFYTFNTERYLMTSENKTLRNVASNAPYDFICIIVNTNHYGGGAIYNLYSVTASDIPEDEYVFTHEFGHLFAGLGDEYYDSETSYIDFYPLDVEPWEPNLTTRVNFDIKWKNMIAKSTPIPTPNDIKYAGIIGLFEGGGYVQKGVYRPSYDCTMKTISVDNFCKVCIGAIEKMISFYTE
jgi:hypothetical protein